MNRLNSDIWHEISTELYEISVLDVICDLSVNLNQEIEDKIKKKKKSALLTAVERYPEFSWNWDEFFSSRCVRLEEKEKYLSKTGGDLLYLYMNKDEDRRKIISFYEKYVGKYNFYGPVQNLPFEIIEKYLDKFMPDVVAVVMHPEFKPEILSIILQKEPTLLDLNAQAHPPTHFYSFWYMVSANKNITEEYVGGHMQYPWVWGNAGLSTNPSITPSFIRKHSDKQWCRLVCTYESEHGSYRYLPYSRQWEYIEANVHCHGRDYADDYIYNMEYNLPEEYDEEIVNEGKKVSTCLTLEHPYMMMMNPLSTIRIFVEYIDRHDVVLQLLRDYDFDTNRYKRIGHKEWEDFFDAFISHHNMSENEDVDMFWCRLSFVPTLSLKFIEKYNTQPWSWKYIFYYNSNVTLDFILRYKEKAGLTLSGLD